MKLLRNLSHLPNFPKGSVVAPGNFDGVHLGHRALLKTLKQKAVSLNLPLIVLLFEPQPAEFFYKDCAPARLTNLREKFAALRQCQVDYIFLLKFNEKLAITSAEAFAVNYFFTGLNAKFLLIGKDFHFGYQRQGNEKLLKGLAKKYQCEISVFDDVALLDRRISSTQIRNVLMQGDCNAALTLLGRHYSISGRVTRGDGRGRQWGIPTANIHLHRLSVPLKGVFCVKVQYDDNLLEGVANIGTRPTVDGTQTILEVHLSNFDKSLYGVRINVLFLHKLRDEIKFTSIEALISQIRNDIHNTIVFFNASA